MFIGQIDQALSRELKCKHRRTLANLSRLEKRQCDENICINKSAHNETVDGSANYITLAQLQRNIRETKPK